MNGTKTDLKYISLVWIVLALLLIPTYAHHGNIILDCGREVYYPTRILQGKILYKDLFNIYGPFAYMFNALLFKVFKESLNVLFASGTICAGFISTLIYLISKRFLPKFLSFSFAFFTVTTGVLNTNLFNFIFPYSYAMLYGLLAFLTSLWLLLNYQETPKKTSSLFLSCFFAGVCFANKYEFLPYLAVIFYSVYKNRPMDFKKYYYLILSLVFVPAVCFGTLFIQGLSLAQMKESIVFPLALAKTQTLKYFYYTQGVYFTKHTLPFLAINFLKVTLPLGLLIFGLKTKNKLKAFFAFVFSLSIMPFLANPAVLSFLPLVTFTLAVWSFKSLKENHPLAILTLSAILVSLKSFWGVATLNYGVFFVGILLVAATAMISDQFKKINLNAVGIYILVLSLILGMQNTNLLKEKTDLLQTKKGNIYTEKIYSSSTAELIEYINNSTKKSEKVVIFPEGLFINFLTSRVSDDWYNSLIPLYVEAFGEEKLIKHFEKTKPDYVIFNNWNNSDYYFKYICSDYGVSLCNYFAKNYFQERVIDKGFRYLIFKKKN